MNVASSDGVTTIHLPQGETMTLPVAVGFDLTGYTARCQIAVPGTPLLMTNGNGGITIVSPSDGTTTLNVSAAQSLALPVRSFAFDFWVISGAGDPTQILTGSFIVTSRVTPLS